MLASKIKTKTFDKFSKHLLKEREPWPVNFFLSKELKENRAVSEAEQIAEKTRVIMIKSQRDIISNTSPI